MTSTTVIKQKTIGYKWHDGNRGIEYNIVNKKKNQTGDCCIRAIAIGLKQSYKQTLKDLCDLSTLKGGMPNSRVIYEHYLFSKGWIKNKPPRYASGKLIGRKMRLKDWGSKCAIVHTVKHLTAVIDNCIYDTWNTSEWCCNSYYTPSNQEHIKVKYTPQVALPSYSNGVPFTDSYYASVATYKDYIDTYLKEIHKFQHKGNKSSGYRARKAIINLSKIGKQLRKDILTSDILTTKNNAKNI